MVDISLSVDENSYRAAVFEIVQFQIEDSSYSGEDVINKNLEKYDKAAKVAAENWQAKRLERSSGEDEIDVKKCEIKNSCDEYNADYCVTNGNSCPGGGNFNFNTGLVFDGKGNLIVRYYKRYLFFEEDINVPKIFRNTYFETDFGNFTIDINFDTMFYDSVKGIEKSGVTSLVFPTYWFDYTPLVFFAIPLQQAWSITYKVNIIAANVHEPRTGSVGSGIYSPDRGVLVYTDNPDGRSKLLISNVPKSPTDDLRNIEPPNTKFFYLDDDEVTELQEEEPRNFQKECGLNVLGALPEDLTDYRCQLTSVRGYEFRKLEGTSGSFGLCSKAFCCSLTYESESMNENYYFGVSSMPLTFQDSYVLGTEACFLARCEPFDGRPCGNFILKSDTVFLFAEMRATFTTKYIYPYAINSDIRLTDKEEWEFDGNSHMFYQNIKNDSLLFLGLYGRKFDEDKILN
ncbi:symplectin [Trichonephila inaurata madagascariensis]|uniref:Symplectin n=1 Tax=Trichonephila inaurata madagascariensis TaxID=2747483 RepID=A0A8X6YIS9_9ARAC|nr:symplectin [Trichonephila inaurata madagascariensis]